MTEAQVVQRLGNTGVGSEIGEDYRTRCWTGEPVEGRPAVRCLLFDPTHRLIDVAGDGIDDAYPALVAPPPLPDWQPPAGAVESAGRWCERVTTAQGADAAPILLTLKPFPLDALSLDAAQVLQVHGVEISSDDPRFADLWIAPGERLMRRPNGDFIDTSVHVSFEDDMPPGQCYMTWNPRPIAEWSNRVWGYDAEVAAKLTPPAGYRLIGAAPVGGDWIGIAERQFGGPQTVLIRASKPAAIMAHLPFAFQAIERLVDMHGPSRWIRLTGRSGGGPIRVLKLEISPAN